MKTNKEILESYIMLLEHHRDFLNWQIADLKFQLKDMEKNEMLNR